MAGVLQTHDADAIKQLLLARMHEAIVQVEEPQARRIVRVEIPVPGVDPLAWLAAQQNRIKGYWVDRDRAMEVAAIGEADEIKGQEAGAPEPLFAELNDRWRNCDANVRYYGGFRFGPWHPADQSWRPFGAYRFILPHFEIVRRSVEDTTLACNLVLAPGFDPVAGALMLLQGMTLPTAFQPGAVAHPGRRWDEPPHDLWCKAVEEALAAIGRGTVDKVVLARRTCFEFEHPVDPFTLVRRMQQDAGRCFQYCGIHGAGLAFIGASPERLYRRDGDQLFTEAVAGTRPRGETEDDDQRFEAELQASGKERQEHRLVSESIVQALRPLASEIRPEPAPSVLKLARVQHLYTRVEAALKPGVSDAALLRALHPTPAVGGAPAAAALKLLAGLERFDRGWYTGPVGWVSRDAAEFAVALRCGLVVGPRLCLFSGAGIVPGSRPEAEWAEIESKIAGFLSILQSA